MSKTATLNLRIDPDVKERAENVLSRLGVPMSTAINIYLTQISLTGGIPFRIALPRFYAFDCECHCSGCITPMKTYISISTRN